MTQTPPSYQPHEFLTFSTLMAFVRCPRRFFYRESGICTRDESNALSYGTAMHKARDLALLSGLNAGIKAFGEIWDESLADERRSLARAKAQLGHYVHTHEKGRAIFTPLAPPPHNLQITDDISPYEIPFVIDVGLPIPIAGRADGWCQHRDTGDFWGYEFKTMSRITASMFDSLELNPQLLTYALVVRTVSGKPIRGMMFEGMLVDPKKVDNITHPIVIQDHHLDDITTWLRYHGELLLACERRLADAGGDPAQAFPKNFAGCSAYPQFYQPGSHCEYANLCRPADWRSMLPYYGYREPHKPFTMTIAGKEIQGAV